MCQGWGTVGARILSGMQWGTWEVLKGEGEWMVRINHISHAGTQNQDKNHRLPNDHKICGTTGKRAVTIINDSNSSNS